VALVAITLESQPLTVAQLAPLDQFHTRRIAAALLDPLMRVLAATNLTARCGLSDRSMWR
jgi:hypothetical protein